MEGVSMYAPHGIRVGGVENPQGFGVMNADLPRRRTRMTRIEIDEQAIYKCVQLGNKGISGLLPNLFAQTGLFLISKYGKEQCIE